MDSLPPSEIAYQEAHINDNLSTSLIVVCTIFTALALLCLLARLISRRLTGMVLSWDDYFAIAAAIPLICLNIAACLIGHWGVGRVLIWVAQHPENFVRIGKTELAFSVCYDWSMALGKLSILALLARVFTLHQKWFKIGVYFWTTWIVLWWTAGCFIIFLECRPLSTNWGSPTQCRPAFKTSVSTGVFNAVSDVGVLILPQPMIWQLQLPILKKLGLSLLFLVGIFATAVSIARIPLLKGANSTANFNSTYTSFIPVVFTVIEPASVLICACMPLIVSLFKHFPKVRLASYLTFSFTRSSRGSTPSAKSLRQPLPDASFKPEQWNKLDESSMSSEANSEGHIKSTPFDGEHKLTTTTAATSARSKGSGLREVRDIV